MTMLKRVLITGGSGFIGTNLVRYFTDRGCQVLNVDIAAPRNPAHHPLWRRLDILDAHALHRLAMDFQPDVIFHMAARTDLRGRSIDDYPANTDGVRSVIGAARALSDLRSVVFASSMLVCELGYRPRHEQDFKPNTAYGRSKAAGEHIVREQAGNAFAWTIVRPTSIWGPWFDVPYRSFFNAVARGLYLHPRGIAVRRSYGFVYNAVFILDKLAQSAAEGCAAGQVFYAADYHPVELREWAEMIRRAMDAPPVRDVPLAVLQLLARCGDLLKHVGMSNPPLSSFRLSNLMTDAVYDLEPTRRICGELPFDLNQSIAMTVKWMRDH